MPWIASRLVGVGAVVLATSLLAGCCQVGDLGPGGYGSRCLDPGPPSCAPGYYCDTTDGVCATDQFCPLLTDSECPNGFVCIGMPGSTSTTELTECVVPCASDADCPRLYLCGFNFLETTPRQKRQVCELARYYVGPGSPLLDGG
jgi:hypothetical protein